MIGTGEQAGIWGETTNNNLGTLLVDAVAGYTSVSITSASQALTAIDGLEDQSRNAMIALTTTTTANFSVFIPASSKTYIFYNASSYVATIYNSTVTGNTTVAGTGVAIPAGKVMAVWSEGTNVAQQNTHLNSPSFTTPALGTPASGTLTNATGLPIDGGTTGTLPVARGGTGVTSSTGTGSVVLSVSPALTGTPTAPTASAGTSSTQIATTAFMATMYPIGSIYTSTVSTNPGTLFGFGTWVAFGAGRVLLGNGGGYTAGATGGSADAIVVDHTHTATSSSSFTGSGGTTGTQSADHVHSVSGTTSGQSNTHTHSVSISDPGHSHTFPNGASLNSSVNNGGVAGTVTPVANFNTTNSSTTGITASAGNASADHSHTFSATSGGVSANHSHSFTPSGSVSTSTSISSTGSSGSGANLQPYVVVYMWNRTA
jgi:hypothetical protein